MRRLNRHYCTIIYLKSFFVESDKVKERQTSQQSNQYTKVQSTNNNNLFTSSTTVILDGENAVTRNEGQFIRTC